MRSRSRTSATSNTVRSTISRRGTKPARFTSANLKAADIIFFNWGSGWMSHPVLVFDFGPDGRVCMSIEVRLPQGAEVLDPPQPLPAAGADLPRRRRARRHPAPHEVQPGARRRTCTASMPAPRSYGPCSSITSNAINQPVREAALVPRPVHELHDVVLPAAQQPGPLRLARDCQRPAGPGPLRGRSAGPDFALRRNSAGSPISTTLRTRPRRRDSGITSAANSKGAAMSDDIIPLLKVHEYFQGVSDETLQEVVRHATGHAPSGRQRRPRGGRRAHHRRLRPARAAQGRAGRAPRHRVAVPHDRARRTIRA